ncbi:hypothetical protein BDF20DRAFT_843740 [Mycotypha africana]|uniref:uncharacterized protein n=1 Tax=Mycotypha africana TaxID=64632 RepID=UPI0023019A35|nr:uncharacterized protein BDF20DRAFT_843740 [Mycotypha africana]KAI8991266.1 hypothetical protein BDF20DRAFT_843740 [Mycotypha africana]
MTVNSNIEDKGLITEWAKSIERVDIDTVQSLYSSCPELLWAPLQLNVTDKDTLKHFSQRLEASSILGTSFEPLYPLHYLILLFSNYNNLQQNDDEHYQLHLIRNLIDFIIQKTQRDEINTCLWGEECNSIMHLAYYFLNQQQQQVAELIQLLIDRGASTTIVNKSGHLPLNRSIEKTSAKPSFSSDISKELQTQQQEEEGPKLIINKRNVTTKQPAAVSDKFKRLREMAEVKSSSRHHQGNSSKLMMGRHNSAHRYFRPGHIEERKRRVLSEEEEAELEKERLKRQREVDLLVQRSAVRNNPLLKKLEVHQESSDHSISDSLSTASKLRTALTSVTDQPQLRRGSRIIQALKDRSYVSDSVLRHQQLLAAETKEHTENDVNHNSATSRLKSNTRLQPISPYASDSSDEENEGIYEDNSNGNDLNEVAIKGIKVEATKESFDKACGDQNVKVNERQDLNINNSEISVVQHHQPDLVSSNENHHIAVANKIFEQPEKRGVTNYIMNDNSIVDSLQVKTKKNNYTAGIVVNDTVKRTLTIKGSKVREIVQVHEHLNDKEEIEIYYTGKVFSVWKKNEYGELTEEEQFTEAQFKKKSPEILELVKEKLSEEQDREVLFDESAPSLKQLIGSSYNMTAKEKIKNIDKPLIIDNSSQRSSTSNTGNDEDLYTSRGSLNSDSTLSTISHSTNDSIQHVNIIDDMRFPLLEVDEKTTAETDNATTLLNDRLDDNYRNSLLVHGFNEDHDHQQRNSNMHIRDVHNITNNEPSHDTKAFVRTSINNTLHHSQNNNEIPANTTADNSLLDGTGGEVEGFEILDDDIEEADDGGATTPTNSSFIKKNDNDISSKDNKQQSHDTVQSLVTLVQRQLHQDEEEEEDVYETDIMNNIMLNRPRRQSGTQRKLWALSYIEHQQVSQDETNTVLNNSDNRSSSSYSEDQWYDPDSKEGSSNGDWQSVFQRESFLTSQQHYSNNNSVNNDDEDPNGNDTASIASSVYSYNGAIISELEEKDSIYPSHGELLVHKPKEHAELTTTFASRTDSSDRKSEQTVEHNLLLPDTYSHSTTNTNSHKDGEPKSTSETNKPSKPIESAKDTMKITSMNLSEDNHNEVDKDKTSSFNYNSGEGEIVIYMSESYGHTTRLDDLVAADKQKDVIPAFNLPLSRMSGKVELKPGQLSLQSDKDYRRSLIPMAEVDFNTVARENGNSLSSNIPNKKDNQPRIEDISQYMRALPSAKQSISSSQLNNASYNIGNDTQPGQPIRDSVTPSMDHWISTQSQLQEDVSSSHLSQQQQQQHQQQPVVVATRTTAITDEKPSPTTSFEINRYGKMFIGVSGAHHMLLPLPKEITYVRCVISDGEYEYMSRYEILTHQILMDYECIIDTKPGQIITVSLHVRPDYHVKPKTGLVSRLFTSARKQKEHLSGYVHPEDGAIGQTRFAVDHMVTACYKKTYEAQFDCFNSWYARTNRERARREQFGDEEDFLKIVGKLNIEMLYLPVSDPSLPVPRSLRECDLTLKIKQWHDTCWKSGYLTTRLQGSNIWERHFYRLVGSQLVGYTSDTDKQRVWKHYNIADVIRLSASTDKVLVTLVEEDKNTDKVFNPESIHSDNRKGFFRLTFSEYYVDCVSDNLEDSEDWVKTLKAMIGRVPLRLPFSAN